MRKRRKKTKRQQQPCSGPTETLEVGRHGLHAASILCLHGGLDLDTEPQSNRASSGVAIATHPSTLFLSENHSKKERKENNTRGQNGEARESFTQPPNAGQRLCDANNHWARATSRGADVHVSLIKATFFKTNWALGGFFSPGAAIRVTMSSGLHTHWKPVILSFILFFIKAKVNSSYLKKWFNLKRKKNNNKYFTLGTHHS